MAVRMERYQGNGEPSKVETLFEGAVLGHRERNWHDDSDFYAIVWDAEKEWKDRRGRVRRGAIRSFGYATTRFATYGNTCTTDATEEVQEAAARYNARLVLADWWAAKKYEAAQVRVGKLVEMRRDYRPRKAGRDGAKKGEAGRVFWRGVDQYSVPRYRNSYKRATYRVGVEFADGRKVFVPESAVEVPADRVAWNLPSPFEGRRVARAYARDFTYSHRRTSAAMGMLVA